MRHKLFAIILILTANSAMAATVDDAVILKTAKPRSADQMECLKANAQDHAGYLACIRAKKGDKMEPPSAINNSLTPSSLDNSGQGIR